MTRQNILVVDDRRENLVAIEALLESPERQLIMATSGAEALQKALRHDLSLILLDVQMPDMDGFEVAALLRQHRRTRMIPIIFVTALSKEPQYVFRGYDCGAVDYLFKPIEERVLHAKVSVFLELDLQKRRLQQALVQMKRLRDENQRLLQALGEGVIGTDAAGRIVFCNDAAATLTGRGRDHLVGSRLDDILSDGMNGSPWTWSQSPLVTHCRQGDHWRTQGQPLYLRRQDDWVPIELSANAINPPDEAFSGVVVLFRDQEQRVLTSQEEQARSMRRHPRRKVFRELVLFDRTTGGNVGRLLDLSLGGFRLRSRTPLQEGARLPLSMVLPGPIQGQNTQRMDGRVVWCRAREDGDDFIAGFQFCDMDEAGRTIIATLMDTL